MATMGCQRCGAQLGFLSSGSRCGACTEFVTNALGAWQRHFDACVADRFLSVEEEAGLRAYQHQLGLRDTDMAPVIPQLMRAKQISAVLAGQLPIVATPGIMLPAGEVAHYAASAALVMTTYAIEYEAATRGSTVRFGSRGHGVSFRTSGTRGRHITVPTQHTIPGVLLVTNRNVSFYGRSNVSMPIASIETYNYQANAVQFTCPGWTTDAFFLVDDGEVVVATFYVLRTKLDAERFGPASQSEPQPSPADDAEKAERRARYEAEAAAETELRRTKAIEQFGEVDGARVFARELWVGATQEMVVAMFGPPADVSEKILKTKTKRIYRYFPNETRSRFGLRITIENDLVTGWER